jgi:hypothetical protein
MVHHIKRRTLLMKKLSLILALVLVVSCALVACGGDEEASSTPETESSVAADASSEAATEESSEAATEESSEAATEESSEAATEESSEAEESETGTIVTGGNVAAGRPYTISGSGTPGAQYAANLTDGIAGEDTHAYDATWFGFYANPGMDPSVLNSPEGKGYVIIDLGEKKDLSQVRIHCGNNEPSGVHSPAWFDVKVSDSTDVDSFEYVAEVPVKDSTTAEFADMAYWAEVDINTSGRYVMISVQVNGTWCWINEIEIYDAQ